MDGRRRSGQHALRDAEVRAGRAQNGAPVPARTHFSSMDGRKTQRRGGLLFGDFLLATQEKVTRAPGKRAEKDMMSCIRYKQRQDGFRIPRYARPRNDDE